MLAYWGGRPCVTLKGVNQRPGDFYVERARKGGIARKKALTNEQRQRIARQAALARHRRSTKAERQEAARKAVLARWAREKGNGG